MRKYTPSDLPAVEEAYPLALASYDTAIKRLDAVDGKLNTLTTFAVTVSLAVPVIAGAKNLSFHSRWFVVAAICFIAGVTVATIARLTGALQLIDPKVIYTSYLDLSPWEFKRRAIYWAGENFHHNQRIINRNGFLAATAAILFALEAMAVACWVLRSLPTP